MLELHLKEFKSETGSLTRFATKINNVFLFRLEDQLDKFCGRYDFSRFVTQLLLMASEEDLNNPKIADLFIKCGKAVD